MMKIIVLIMLLVLIAINFFVTKKALVLFTFYLETIPRNPYLTIAKELKIGQSLDLKMLENLSLETDLFPGFTLVAISKDCSKCKDLIDSFTHSNIDFSKFVFLCNGIIPEKQREILIEKDIKFVESEKVFSSYGIRSVPKAIQIEGSVITSVNSIADVSDFQLA